MSRESPAGSGSVVDTGKVADRRRLRFESPREMHAEVDRLLVAERAGTLCRVGNWTLGQSLGHLGAWVNFGFDGNPVRPPWLIKLYLKVMKNKYMNNGLPAGVKIPNVPGGTLATEPLSTEEGLRRFRAAWERLEAGAPGIPNPVFGPLTHEEWKKIHLRHAELHLGFFHA